MQPKEKIIPRIRNNQRRRNKTDPIFLIEVQILARKRTRMEKRRPNAHISTRDGIQGDHA